MSMISEKLRKARQGVKEEDTPAAQALRLAAYGAASGRSREREEQEAQGLQSLRLAAYGAAQDAALANARRPAPSYAGTLRAVPDSDTGTSARRQYQDYLKYIDLPTGARMQEAGDEAGLAKWQQDRAAWEYNRRYGGLSSAPDYAEKSRFRSRANGKPVSYALTMTPGVYSETGYDSDADLIYNAVNGDENARKVLNAQGVSLTGSAPVGLSYEGWYDLPEATVRNFNYIFETQGAEAALGYLDESASHGYTPSEAFAWGALQGSGAASLAEAAGSVIAPKRAREAATGINRAMGRAQAEQPLSFGAGSTTATLAQMAAIGQGVGSIGALGKLPDLAQRIIRGAATFGGSSAIQNIGAAATENIGVGDYLGRVGTAALGGATGAAAGGLISQAMGRTLTTMGLTGNKLARSISAGISSAGFAAGSAGVQELAKYLQYPEGYELDAEEVTKNVLVAFALGTISYLTSAGAGAQQSTAAEEAYKSKYFDGMTVEEAKAEYRRLAKMYHPDLHPGDAAAASEMQQINDDYARYVFVATAANDYREATTSTSAETASVAAERFTEDVRFLQEISNSGILSGTQAEEAIEILSAAAAELTVGAATPTPQFPYMQQPYGADILAQAALGMTRPAEPAEEETAAEALRKAAANAAQVASEESEERSFADAQDDKAGERIVTEGNPRSGATSPSAHRNDRAEKSSATEGAQEERPAGERGRQIAAPTEENEAARAAENVTLTAEDRAAEVRRVAVDEAGLSAEAGDTLADIFTQAAPEGVDPAAFAAVNGYFYQAGERGLPFDKVRENIPAGAWSAARGTEEIAQYAYNRGRMKTLAQEAEAERRQREAERKAAERAQLAREAERNRRLAASEAGLHEDDFTRSNLSAADARRIDETARLLGTPVYVVGNNEINAGRANGEIVEGRAVLLEQGLFEGKNAGTGVGLRIAGHEWGHRLKRLAPTEYGQVVEALRPLLTKEIERKRHLYNEQNGLGYSDAALTEEAVNDRLGDMLSDGRILDEFIEEHRQKRGLLQRMWEVIKSLVRKLTGAEKRAAQSAEAKLRKALDAAATAARQESSESRVQSSEGTENAAQEGGGVKFSLKEDSEGRELTEAQAAYFADSKAVDEDGRLLVLYHGTDADFTVFDPSKGRANMDIQGMFFSPWDIDAGGYGGNVGAYYLNLTNPASEAVGYKALNRFKGQNNAGVKAREWLIAQGYDGVNNGGEEYIAFYPEQIKRTDNLSPTGDPDIRYSLKEADELYNREYDFTQPMTTDEFRELIKQENDPERYFPKGLSPEFLKTITNKSRFTRPKLYRGIEAAEFDFLAENGYLKSNSSYNFANQQGQTLADEDAGYALSYATGFAPKDIADKHYKDGLPTYLIEFINAPDLNVGKNEVQESYTYGEIDQRFITRVFEIMYDQETGKDMIQDVTNDAYTRAALPRLGWALSGLSHGVPKFYRDKTTGTILYAVQGADGYENGLYVSEKFPDVTFRYSQLGKEFKPEAAQQFFGVSGDEADLEPVRVGEDGRLVHDDGVRYSLKEPDAATMEELTRENERLRKRVEYWKGQTKQTRGLHLRYGDLSRLTGQLVKDYGAELDEGQTAALEESLRRLARVMREDPKGLQYSEMLAHAEEIARELVQNARELVNDDEYQDYRDLRKWLRGQKLTISRSDAAGIADFNEWKKAHSAIRVGYDNGGLPIDTAYAELAEQFPGFFPEEIDNPTDQLERIGEILDSVGPVYENPYSPYMAAAIEEAGYDVLERIMDEDTVRPAAPTRADKQAAKYEARLDAKDEQIKDLRERYTWNVAQRVAQERAKRDSMIAAIKGHQAEVREKERNRRQESRDRDRLLRVARRLAKLKTTEANRAVINELIGDLDLVSKGLTTESIENLVKLREWYEGKTTEGSDNYDPDFIADKNTLDKLRRLEQRQIKDLTITEVRELTESLLNIEHEIRTAKKLIDSEDRRDVYYQALDIAQHMEDTKGWKKGLVSGMLSPERFARRVTGYAEGDPLQRAMSGLSAGKRTMLDYQRRALQDVSRWTGNREFMRRWSGKDAQRIRIDGDDGLGHHVTATITPGMLASLYLHSLNDDNMRHVAKGGVTIPNAEAYRKGDYENAYRNATTMRLQRSQIQRLAQEHLSAEDRAFIRAIMRYFNETSKAALGETAEKLLGYSPFNVDHYFPISVDQNFLHTDFDSMGEDGSVKETLADPGYAQERKQDSKPIDLRDANDVLADAIRKHSQYVGLAIPVRNVNKLIKVEFGTYTEEGERVSHTGSLKKTLNKTFGKAAIDYLNQLMKDVQGNRTRDNSRIGDLIARMRSNYAGAVLTLNAGVAIKQAASYPTAAAVLKYRHLARALKYMAPGVKVDTDLIQRYTPLLWYRSLGYSSQEQGELQNRGKPIPKKLNWIQAMDVKTTAALWKAAEYQIAEERKDLQRGSDGFYKAVAELYNRVIEETQPNYSVMQRPEILRTTNELTKTLNMFKTQPFQNFNILYDAVGDWQAQRRAYSAAANDEARAEARKRMDAAKRKLGRALSSQLISSLVLALVQYAWDVFRGKDDKYKDKEGNADPAAWLKGIGLNMLGNGFGMLPFGSELLEWGEALTDKLLQNAGGDPFFEQKFYGFDASVLETMTNLATGAASLIARTVQTIQNATDSEKKTDWEAMVREAYDAAVNVSQALGIPVENVRKTLTAVAERVLIRAAGPYLGEYYAMRIADEPKSGNSRQYYDLLYRAMENDKAAYEELYKLFIDDGSGLFTHEKIRENMEKRMKAAQGVNSVTDLAERYEGTGYMSAEQQKRYDELLGPLTRSSLWREATKDQRGRVEDKLYQLAAETSTSSSAGTKLQEKIDAAGKAGISEGEYMLYLLALSMADEPSKTSGEYGTYTNDEQEAALDMLDGLSREKKSWLWMSTHDSDKNNPYK